MMEMDSDEGQRSESLQMVEDQVPVSDISTTTSDLLNASAQRPLATTQALQPLSEPARSKATRDVSSGEWGHQHCSGLVLVTQQKGRHWVTHGHNHQGATFLLPEEALFLMECKVLEVINTGGRILSLQEAYHSLLFNSHHLLLYQVYASLKRIGFIVNRSCLSRQNRSEKGDETTPSSEPVCPLCRKNRPTADQDGCDGGEKRVELLEVWQPRGSNKSTPYKKSQPGLPYCRVIVARADDDFPSVEQIGWLCNVLPLATLKVCVVDGSDLSYYTLNTMTSS